VSVLSKDSADTGLLKTSVRHQALPPWPTQDSPENVGLHQALPDVGAWKASIRKSPVSPRRPCMPIRPMTLPSCANGYVNEESPHAWPAKASNPARNSASTDGSSSAPSPGYWLPPTHHPLRTPRPPVLRLPHPRRRADLLQETCKDQMRQALISGLCVVPRGVG
jgi:hypothetical protein